MPGNIAGGFTAPGLTEVLRRVTTFRGEGTVTMVSGTYIQRLAPKVGAGSTVAAAKLKMCSIIDSGRKIVREEDVMGAPCFICSKSEGAEVDMQR